MDGITIEDVKCYGEQKLLNDIEETLKTGNYRPLPVGRTYIPKNDGKESKHFLGFHSRLKRAGTKEWK